MGKNAPFGIEDRKFLQFFHPNPNSNLIEFVGD